MTTIGRGVKNFIFLKIYLIESVSRYILSDFKKNINIQSESKLLNSIKIVSDLKNKYKYTN